jgi:hypothetical protein
LNSAVEIHQIELPLPAIGIEWNRRGNYGAGYIRVIRNMDRVKNLRKDNLVDGLEPFFWGADDNWYEAINIRNMSYHNWLLRQIWLPSDLIKCDFELRILDGPPIDVAGIFKELLGAASLSPEQRKMAASELRQCRTCEEVVSWYEKYDTIGLNRY